MIAPERLRRATPGRLIGAAVDVLFPERCIRCGRFGAALHEACLDELPLAGGERCDRCWGPGGADACTDCGARAGDAAQAPGPLRATRAPYRFTGEVRAAVLEAKFRGRTRLLHPLARRAARVVPPDWGIEVVTAVPQDASRRRRRGFNPAAIIARAVAEELGAPLREELLRRVAGGPRQATLGRAERALAVRDAFHAAPPATAPPATAPPATGTAASGTGRGAVLLVDDVATTSATLSACAGALAEAGHGPVYALVLARED